MEKITLFVEKTPDRVWGRVHYDDNLTVADGISVAGVKDKMKRLLHDFHELKIDNIEFNVCEETSTITYYEVADHKFKLKYFFDVDTQNEGHSIYLEKEHHGLEQDEFLGEIIGTEIPEASDYPDETEEYLELRKAFDHDVLQWLDNNYFS